LQLEQNLFLNDATIKEFIGFLWVTWHCHIDSNLGEKRKFFIGLGYSSRQGAKNAKFGNLFCFFAAPSTFSGHALCPFGYAQDMLCGR
jgi:hypothetical protein